MVISIKHETVNFFTLYCPICHCHGLHLEKVRQRDSNHPNKIILFMQCDCCGKSIGFHIWGHDGKEKSLLYLITKNEKAQS